MSLNIFEEFGNSGKRLCFEIIFQYTGSIELYNLQCVCKYMKNQVPILRKMHLCLSEPININYIFQSVIIALLKNNIHMFDKICLKYGLFIKKLNYVYPNDTLFYLTKNIRKNNDMLKILQINDIRN